VDASHAPSFSSSSPETTQVVIHRDVYPCCILLYLTLPACYHAPLPSTKGIIAGGRRLEGVQGDDKTSTNTARNLSATTKMIVITEKELTLLAGAGGLALYAGKQGPKCPFHRMLFAASNLVLLGGGVYVLWRSWSQSPPAFWCSLQTVRKKSRERLRGGKKARGEDAKHQDARVAAVLDLVRPNIWELEPYRCARDDYSEGILLDANENSFGSALPPEDRVLELERYPDPYQQPLKEKIAVFRNVRPEQIFVGVGSDEAIDLIMRVFCEPGRDQILVTPPTYGMYKVSAKTNDVGIVAVPLTPEFAVRVPEVLQAVAVSPRVKVIFLCSPGNPTAKLVPLEVVEQVLQGASGCMVVVDEAYVDFANANAVSACQLVEKYPNCLVLQTLSKAFGLAGIRCGMAIGHPAVIQVLNNVKAPYNVSQLTSHMAHKVFTAENLAVLQQNVSDILKEKTRVVEALQGLPAVKKIHPSDTNFILFEVPRAQEIYRDMAEAGVVARFRGHELHCKDCIRLTIGQAHENDTFLDLFKKTTEKYLGKYT